MKANRLAIAAIFDGVKPYSKKEFGKFKSNSLLALASRRICKRQLAALSFVSKHSKLLSSAFCDFPNLSKKQASAIRRLSKNKALRVFCGGGGKTISTMDYFTPKPEIK